MTLGDRSNTVSTPFDAADKGDDDNDVEPKIATLFRANSAWGNFMCSDRSDIQYTANKLRRRMVEAMRHEYVKEFSMILVRSPKS